MTAAIRVPFRAADPSASLVVLGSGSKGNAFAITCGDALLLVDAGFSCREVERRLELAGLALSGLVAIALTHEHGDHASGATRLARKCGVPVVTSLGTFRALARGGDPCDFIAVGTRGPVEVGPFLISACPTSHDAAEPVALGITLPDGTAIGVAYDLGRPTQAVRWFLREMHCLVLEANHDDALLRTSGYPVVVQQRIAGPTGHLSNHDAIRLLDELHHAALNTVVLAHLSQRCNHPDTARRDVAGCLEALGFRGELVIALQDGPMSPIAVRGPLQRSLFR
ncbi:MAG: MBL fold metallo-hydrolase [Gemmatimonadales bacterium]|nr:MBL fold metallo-hydrolase [Gemmatimonadales bacterium]